MRVKIVANIVDENGAFDPCYHRKANCECDVKELHSSVAEDYISRKLAVAWPEKVQPAPVVAIVEEVESTGEIQTPEDNLPEKETATIKRRRRAN